MKAVLGALALTLIAVGANAWLLRVDAAREVLTPDPPRVAQNFIGALAARRPGVARNLVAREARDELSEEHLAALAGDLRARHGTFRFAEAVAARRGDAASVRTRLRTARSGDVEYVIALSRETASGLWKVVAMSGPRHGVSGAASPDSPAEGRLSEDDGTRGRAARRYATGSFL